MYPLEEIKARCIPIDRVKEVCGVPVPQVIKWLKEKKLHKYEFVYPEISRYRQLSIDTEEVLRLKEEEGL